MSEEDLRTAPDEHRCLICNLNQVRAGSAFVYDERTPGCPGGKRYSGFTHKLRPHFEYFLSCGIPGKLEGEHYKKTPELVKTFVDKHPTFQAPGRYLVFKRWDKVAPDEEPAAVVFFATPDTLSGLFTLATFDTAEDDGVIAPMGAGCSSIINYPYQESKSERPRGVLGMFDVSARPCVPADRLTFAVPMKRFEQMVRNMDESFLTTESWQAVRSRL